MDTAEKQAQVSYRMYSPDDYELIKSWWKNQNWVPVPKDMLPTLGIISMIDNKEVCAGFLYTSSNSDCMWMEWFIADPTSEKEARSLALTNLIDNLLTLAELNGAKYIVTSVQHPRLIERLEKNGFIKADTAMINMVKRMV